MIRILVLSVGALALAHPAAAQSVSRAQLDAMIASHAQANNLPAALVHRVVRRESRYRPHVVGRGGAMGLMQIKVATARGLGYRGSARGLLDPETNLKYAVRYLAGAYMVAGGNYNRAVMHYARGYYYAAKHKGLLDKVAARTGSVPDSSGKRAQILAADTATGGTAHEFFRRDGEILF
jgi:soluble lytic murein transglycosylase-like protein